VSWICALLDEELAEFRDRPLDEPYPYVWFDHVWFDPTYEKVREGGRIVSQAAVVAIHQGGTTGRDQPPPPRRVVT
jgi:putative transposase